MQFSEYQKKAIGFAVYPSQGNNYSYPALGVTAEAGEVVNKIKRVIRDKDGVMSQEDKEDIGAEIGDVLWYLATLATELGQSLADIAQHNLDKLQGRKDRGTLHGSGDIR